MKISKKTYTAVWFYICSLIPLMIMITNYRNGDYEGYKIMYNNCNSAQYWLETGYWLLEKLFYKAGFEFFFFRMAYLVVAYILLINTIYRYSENPKGVLILYCIFPFLFDGVQIRNFMAAALVLFAIRFLERKDKKGKIIFLIFIFIATSQHLSAMIYVLFLLAQYWELDKIRKITLSGVVGISVLLILLGVIGSKISAYLSAFFGRSLLLSSSNIKSACVWILCAVLISFFTEKYFYKEKKEILYKLSYLSCLFLPLILFSFNMYRMYRNMIIINYILLCKKEKKFKLHLGTVIAVIYALILFYVQLSERNSGNYVLVTEAVFKYNYLFEFLGL